MDEKLLVVLKLVKMHFDFGLGVTHFFVLLKPTVPSFPCGSLEKLVYYSRLPPSVTFKNMKTSFLLTLVW